jgi:hypothetical protein
MARMKTDALVNKVIKLHGPVIDLRANPEVIIDILRRFADDLPDGGTPCGGVPNPPPPPSSVEDRVRNDEIMKAVLKLSRDVSAIKKSLTALGARGRSGR